MMCNKITHFFTPNTINNLTHNISNSTFKCLSGSIDNLIG